MLSGLFQGQLKYNNDIIKTCAGQTELCIPKLKGKCVGVITNQTSVIGKTHLLGSFIYRGINIVKVFGSQRGF
ncbi:hypothetical protein CMU81_10960 [Elizabethkingia anophelis]|uniref:Uncharacterized protein n=1 Tax=Elizabethkingia anophelis TaxID=1117645 RepID=A0A1T3DFA9_9FLAO|nr:hypothetical protein AYC66_11585 [Elizabethkingia anophelis]KFC34530.1 hypothetical protein FF18_07550 [Elizabethkingia anophelis]MDV2472668.1 hypothetical protein [Elizabethkingia anophelis]MDV3499984.1 hypothetical protein [Elizabethkingia anophelis]MDV3535884.1 hypothetical protein [Elizabethkingia anophelis]